MQSRCFLSKNLFFDSLLYVVVDGLAGGDGPALDANLGVVGTGLNQDGILPEGDNAASKRPPRRSYIHELLNFAALPFSRKSFFMLPKRRYEILQGGATVMAKVELKKPVVEEISAQIADAESVILVNYSGLTVEQDTKLRKELREAGVHYKVYKNTMMNFAFQGTPCEELCKDLEGTNALAISKDDATAPARIIAKFAKTAPKLEMVSGIVEGSYYDKKGVEALAAVPSREELLGKLLGSIQSPIANLARVLNQIAESKGGEAAEA